MRRETDRALRYRVPTPFALISLFVLLNAPVGAVLLEQTTDVSRMIRNPKDLLQHDGNPPGRPAVVTKAKSGCPASDKRWNLSELFIRQRGLATGSRMMAQCLDASPIQRALEPLADRALRDSQRRCDADLRPTLLVKFPGVETTNFTQLIQLVRSRFGHSVTLLASISYHYGDSLYLAV
jgi:hypothetical protein